MRTWVHPQLLPLRNLPFPPPQKRPAAQPSTARPQSRKSPKILQILLQTIRPFPRRKKDPPPRHQPDARNPENLPISCKSCFRQSALSPPQKRPAAQPSTARPQSRKSPNILQILLQTIRPFPRRKKDPPTSHQPFACNPENPPKSCKSCFRQSALSPPQKRPAAQPSTARPQSRKSPKILQILLQTTSTPILRCTPHSLPNLPFLSLIRDTKRMEVPYTELFDK